MSDDAASRIERAIDSLGESALRIKAERDDLENKIAVAKAIIDRCIRLAGRDARSAALIMQTIAIELRALREGILK